MADDLKISRWALGVGSTIAIVLVGQTVTAIIWGARLSATVEAMQSQLQELKGQVTTGTQYRYTSEDASRDKQAMLELYRLVLHRIDLSEKRIERLEGKG